MSCSGAGLMWAVLRQAQTSYHYTMAAAEKGLFCLFLTFGTGNFSWLIALPRVILLRKCRNSLVPVFVGVSIPHVMHILALQGTQGRAGQEKS